MTTAESNPSVFNGATPHTDWVAVARALGASFAARTAANDAEDRFVAENYEEMKAQRLFSAGVPAELGGGGASYSELCAMHRELARHCSSTALALSMHTHLLAALVWRYHQGHPVAPVLQRIVNEQVVLVSTGAGDWLDSNGRAEKVEGGFRITARKTFASGSPAGDLLMTTALYDDPEQGMTVIHFPAPMRNGNVSVGDNWRTMTMRGTGSNDVVIDGLFIPEASVSLRRVPGKWHPFYNTVVACAMPLIMSVYLGVAEAARDLALAQVARRREDVETQYLTGELENLLTTAQLAVESMVAINGDYRFAPTDATASALLTRKTIAADALIATVEKALELAGGAGLFRSMGLERLVRDIHGAQFHPLPAKRQQRFTGRHTLGLDPIG